MKKTEFILMLWRIVWPLVALGLVGWGLYKIHPGAAAAVVGGLLWVEARPWRDNE
jgi:hypothetical protein